MNERIKELKEQARDFYLNQEDLDWSPQELHNAVEAKFAELIVQECVTKAEQEEDRYFEMGEVDFAYVMKNFQNLLKQDFGVE